ncbi:MAG: hypothetical protein ACKPKO_61870 [Candidatus Fonsibacter sp.]
MVPVIARFLPVIVPADAVRFPTVLIVPPALKVVPTLIEPTDEICPCGVICPSTCIVV